MDLPSDQQPDQLMVQRAKKNPITLTGLDVYLFVLRCPLISRANAQLAHPVLD